MPRTKQFNEEEVLQKALDVFWRKGYHATSVQDLVEALGINRASIYHAFGDKQKLFELAFQKYRSSSFDWVKEFLSGFESVKEGFRKLLEYAVQDSLNDADCKGCFVVNSITELIPDDQTLQPQFQEHNSGMIQFFKDTVQRGIDQGEVPPDKDAYGIAVTIFTIQSGLKVLAKANKDPKPLQALVNTSLDLLD